MSRDSKKYTSTSTSLNGTERKRRTKAGYMLARDGEEEKSAVRWSIEKLQNDNLW